MSNRFKIRMYESANADAGTSEGTIVLPVDRCFVIDSESAEAADASVRHDIETGKLPSGRIYQICPTAGNPEPVRSVAASTDGSFVPVFLDRASGLYAGFCRIRYAVELDAVA